MFSNPFKRASVDVSEALRRQKEEQAIILDVRTREEWKTGHAPGAMHISLQSLTGRAAKLEGSQVLAICRSGSRSGRAAGYLRSQGIDALNVRGGMNAWNRAGLPTTKKG